MDCSTARLLLNFARPLGSELEADEAEALTRHVRECPECGRASQSHQRVDEALGKAMQAVPIPAGLRDRLLTRLASERDRWYQRLLLRRLVPAAAAVALAVGAWFWWPPALTQVHLDDLAHAINNLPRSAEELEEAFHQDQITTRAPRQFNYGLLTHFGLAEFQNQPVPVLDFRAGLADARVYILDAQRFDLNFLDVNPHGSGRCTIVVEFSGDGLYAYLIVFSGGTLEPFRSHLPHPAT